MRALLVLFLLSACSVHTEHLYSRELTVSVVSSAGAQLTVESLLAAWEILGARGVDLRFAAIREGPTIPLGCSAAELDTLTTGQPTLYLASPGYAYLSLVLPLIRGCASEDRAVAWALLGWDAAFNGKLIAHELLHLLGSPHYFDDPVMVPETTLMMLGR